MVGDLPEDTRGALPQIEGVQYSASSANTAAATSLYITGAGTYEVRTGAIFTVTGNGVPVSQDAASSDFSGYGILTTPLVAGTYSLVVTETALDGETSQTNPVTVTVTAPGSRSIKAEEAGPIVGGPISAANHGNGNLDLYPQSEHPNATTDASGTAAVPLQGNLSDNGGTLLYPTDAEGLEVSGGEDSVTGQTIPLNLFAPPGATVIDPATSLLEQADTDATAPLTSPDAVDYAFEDRRIDTALGLPTTLDLDTADPLAMAAAGNDTLLLKEIELQDTAFLLTPFTVDGVDDLSSADPLYVIDKSLSIYPFEAIINDKPPAITTKPIDFTSTAEVLSWMTTYDTTPIFGSYDTVFDASVLPVAAAIIAASNAAVEAHAAAATSQADALSYALAVEKTAFSGEQQAFQALANPDYFDNLAQQQAGFAALQTEYTGAGLAALVATTLAQNVQVTGFTTASTTAAAYTTFTITFSAPVGGITAGDFTLSESAGLSGAAITAVTPVAGSEGASYTVTASTGVGTGTLALGFNADSITNAAGLPLDSGDFAAPAYYGSTTVDDGGSNNALGLALGDFTGDGRPDIVTANDSIDGLTLYVDGAGGSFTAEPAIYTGPSPAKQVVVGDFNGDGKLDALTLNANFPGAYDETVSALLGNGDGTFGTPIQTDIGPNVQEVLTGDFNGDGKLDLAVLGNAHYYTDGTVQLFDGKGDGTFTPGAVFDLGSPLNTDGFETKDMVEADLNGDGHPDLVIATATLNSFAANATVLLGDGHGGFTVGTPMALGLGSSPALIAVGDVNGDGIPDIVAVPQLTGGAETAEILLGHGDGTFGAATTVALPLPPGGSGNVINGNDYNTAVTIGDVTGDGHADIVVGNNETGIVVVPGKGDGTFGTGFVAQPGTGTFYGTLALADVNGDGLSDLVTTDSSGAYASSSVPPGISVAFNTPQTVLPAAASTAVTRAAQAQPTLMQSSGPGSLTHTGNSYTLNLGTVAQGSTVTAVLALLNAAAAPADSFDGTFTAAAGSGFAVSGARLSAALAAGQSGGGLSFTADTSTLGSQTETISFDPRDLTDDPAPVATLATDIADGETATTTEAPADAGGADVSFELDPIQIAVTDTVVSSGALAAPTITGTAAEQAGTDEAAIKPFAAVTIGDGNAGQVDTVVVTPGAAANGTLSDPAAASDDSNLGANGSITVSGSAAQVTAVLDGLVFTPTPHQAAPGSAVTTGFTLAVSDTAGQTASDSTTSTVVTAVLDRAGDRRHRGRAGRHGRADGVALRHRHPDGPRSRRQPGHGHHAEGRRRRHGRRRHARRQRPRSHRHRRLHHAGGVSRRRAGAAAGAGVHAGGRFRHRHDDVRAAGGRRHGGGHRHRHNRHGHAVDPRAAGRHAAPGRRHGQLGHRRHHQRRHAGRHGDRRGHDHAQPRRGSARPGHRRRLRHMELQAHGPGRWRLQPDRYRYGRRRHGGGHPGVHAGHHRAGGEQPEPAGVRQRPGYGDRDHGQRHRYGQRRADRNHHGATRRRHRHPGHRRHPAGAGADGHAVGATPIHADSRHGQRLLVARLYGYRRRGQRGRCHGDAGHRRAHRWRIRRRAHGGVRRPPLRLPSHRRLLGCQDGAARRR